MPCFHTLLRASCQEGLLITSLAFLVGGQRLAQIVLALTALAGYVDPGTSASGNPNGSALDRFCVNNRFSCKLSTNNAALEAAEGVAGLLTPGREMAGHKHTPGPSWPGLAQSRGAQWFIFRVWRNRGLRKKEA